MEVLLTSSYLKSSAAFAVEFVEAEDSARKTE